MTQRKSITTMKDSKAIWGKMLFEVSEAAKGQTHGSLFSVFTDCSFIQTNGPFISWHFLNPLLQVLSSYHSQGDGRKLSCNYCEILSGSCLDWHSYFPSSYKCVRLPLTFPSSQGAAKEKLLLNCYFSLKIHSL